MDCEQPLFQFLPTEEIMSYGYDTWPAGTWVPIPQTDNQYNEDAMVPTSEVVEPPAQYEYTSGYEHMDCEQPMFHVLPTEEIMSYECDTWPAGTRMPIPQAETRFNEDIMGPSPQFELTRGYEYMDYEQPMLQVLPTEEMSQEYDTCPAGTWVPIPQTENQFHEDVIGPTSEVVEPPAQFEYARDYEQHMFRILMAEEVIIYGYGTWPASRH